MIRLNKNPVEGSAVKINISFRDSFGAYYVPSELTYTYLALNSDKESWSVIEDYYKKPLVAESSVNLMIPDTKIIEGKTLTRKIIVEWSGYVDGEYTDFKDEINFDIDPMPYISNKPDDPEPETVYIKVVDVSLQVGSLTAAPITPVFKIRTNLPIIIDEANIVIKDEEGNENNCNVSLDSSYTVLTVVPEVRLNFQSSYSIVISNLKCKIGDYELEEPAVINFVTEFSNTFLEYDKVLTVTENGEIDVLPSAGYDGIANLKLTTAVPIQDSKDVEIASYSPIEIEPDTGFVAIKKVNLTVNLPVEDEKEATFIANGEFEIEPDVGFTSMKKAKVNVEIPVDGIVERTFVENGSYHITPNAGKSYIEGADVTVDVPLQDSKEVSISEEGSLTIQPDSGFTAMKEVTVHVSVGGSMAMYAYDGSDGRTFYSNRRISGTGTYTMIVIPSLTVDEGFNSYNITKIGTELETEYDGATVTLTRNTSKDITR